MKRGELKENYNAAVETVYTVAAVTLTVATVVVNPLAMVVVAGTAAKKGLDLLVEQADEYLASETNLPANTSVAQTQLSGSAETELSSDDFHLI